MQHLRPFADVAAAFFEYLVGERGLRPASVEHYRHHLDRFEAYLKIGLKRTSKAAAPHDSPLSRAQEPRYTRWAIGRVDTSFSDHRATVGVAEQHDVVLDAIEHGADGERRSADP